MYHIDVPLKLVWHDDPFPLPLILGTTKDEQHLHLILC